MLNLFRKKKIVHNPSKIILDDKQLNELKRHTWQGSEAAKYYHDTVERQFFNNVTAKYFLEYISKEDKVLDVGAGDGRLSFAIAEQGNEVTSLDISQALLDLIEEHKQDLNITTIHADGEKLPFDNDIFDKVVSLDCVFHFTNWKDFVKEQIRVVKPNGLILFNMYNSDNLKKVDKDLTPIKIIKNFMANSNKIIHTGKEELLEFCNENNLELIKLQPYNFFAGSGAFSHALTGEECVQFRELYYKLLKSSEVCDIISKIEKEIIKNLDADKCANMIVILRRKS